MNKRTQAEAAWRRRHGGLSIVELLMALAISAMLLTGLTMALNASFYAYASAAESASTQSSSRMVMHRLMAMVRTTTLHNAYDPNDASVALLAPEDGPTRSVGLQMISIQGQLLRVWWQANASYGDADLGDLMYSEDGQTPQPLLERVHCLRDATDDPYIFTLISRFSDEGLLLRRATLDMTVEPGADATLALEDAQGASEAVRLVSSTMPRRNLD